MSKAFRFFCIGRIYFLPSIFRLINFWIPITESSKVHFVTHLTGIHESPYICPSLRSAISSGLSLTLIGLNSPEDRKTRTPHAVLKYLQSHRSNSIKDEDIVVFSDGHRTLYAANETLVVSAYLEIEQMNSILFSSERSCWPGSGGCAMPHSSVQSSFKYVHAGGWIARYKVAIKFLVEWVNILDLQPEESRCNQLALHQYMMGRATPDVHLYVDYNCTIFQTSQLTSLSNDKWYVPDIRGPFMRSDGSIFNSETQTAPLIYLLNDGTGHMIEMEKTSWHARKMRDNFLSKYQTNYDSFLRENPPISTCKILTRSSNIDDEDGLSKLDKSRHRHQTPDKSILTGLYPAHVPVFSIRADTTSGEAVSRGRMKLLRDGSKSSLVEYKALLQCSPLQPELYGKGGALKLAAFIPLTRDTLHLVSAYLESGCPLWNGCREVAADYLQGKYPPKLVNYMDFWASTKMFRIMNGSFYYDWPWGTERFNMMERESNYRIVISEVLQRVSDIPDSVFFCGGEIDALPPNIPVPYFSSAPRFTRSSDIPMVWNAAFMNERWRSRQELYSTVIEQHEDKLWSLKCSNSNSRGNSGCSNISSSDTGYRGHSMSWDARQDKAAFFGSMSDGNNIMTHVTARQVVMNIAISHPEHVVAKYTICFHLAALNPGSTNYSNCDMSLDDWRRRFANATRAEQPFGYGDRSIGARFGGIERDEYMVSYRYLIIIGGISSADRLNTFLAHSGAVILLQETDYLYHFSAFLKPWVHYVPIAFNGADVLEKVLWLKAHPRLAERLALNGRNFGASYLRTEDYYCYAASALEAVAKIADPSALKPFNATLL